MVQIFSNFGTAAIFFSVVVFIYIFVLFTAFITEAAISYRRNTVTAEREIEFAIEKERKRDIVRRRNANKAKPPSPDDEVSYSACEYLEDWGHFSRESITKEVWKTPDYMYSKPLHVFDSELSKLLENQKKFSRSLTVASSNTDDPCVLPITKLTNLRRTYTYQITKQIYSFINLRIYISGMIINRRDTSKPPTLTARIVTPVIGDITGGDDVYRMELSKSIVSAKVPLMPKDDSFNTIVGSSRFSVHDATLTFLASEKDGVVAEIGDLLQILLIGADEIFVTSFSCILPIKNGCMVYDPTSGIADNTDTEVVDDEHMQVLKA